MNRSLAPHVLFGLMALALLSVAAARWSGVQLGSETPSEVVASAQLSFEDGAEGAVHVYDLNQRVLLETFEAGEGSFVRGVLRSMTRERRMLDAGNERPFLLARHSDGALTLEDEATGRLMVLNAFGPTNAGVFARLLDASLASS